MVSQAAFTAILCLSSIYLTVNLSTTVTWIFTAVFVFHTAIAPGMLMWAQRFKKYVSSPMTFAGANAVPIVRSKGLGMLPCRRSSDECDCSSARWIILPADPTDVLKIQEGIILH